MNQLKIGYWYSITLSGKTWTGLVTAIHDLPGSSYLPGSPPPAIVHILAGEKSGGYFYDDVAENAVELGPCDNVEELVARSQENERIVFELMALYLNRRNSKPSKRKPSEKDFLKELGKDATAVLAEYRRGKRIKTHPA
jgi:hypothetical protein